MTEPSHTRGPAASRRRDSRYQRARRRSPRTARRALALARPTARRTFCNHEQLPSRVSVYPRRRRGMNPPPRLTAAARISRSRADRISASRPADAWDSPRTRQPPRDSQVAARARRWTSDPARRSVPLDIPRSPSPGRRHRLFLRLPLHRLEARRCLPCPRRRRRRRTARLARTGPPLRMSSPSFSPRRLCPRRRNPCTWACLASRTLSRPRAYRRGTRLRTSARPRTRHPRGSTGATLCTARTS